MRALEASLLDGSIPAGTRMPAERVLAEQYGVARNTIREAIQRLTARGLVRSRPGSGVFVTDQLRKGILSPWGQLIADHPALLNDILEFRRVLEGATAYFAAQRADDSDRDQIQALLTALEQARAIDDKVSEARADARLHEAIARASHNTMFLHLQSSIVSVLRENITTNGNGLREQNDYTADLLLTHHRNVCIAILEKQPEEARDAMQTHIDFVLSQVAHEAL